MLPLLLLLHRIPNTDYPAAGGIHAAGGTSQASSKQPNTVQGSGPCAANAAVFCHSKPDLGPRESLLRYTYSDTTPTIILL